MTAVCTRGNLVKEAFGDRGAGLCRRRTFGGKAGELRGGHVDSEDTRLLLSHGG